MLRSSMRVRFLPLLLLALLAPLVAAIALHRSGARLGQPVLALSVLAPALPGGLPVELRATYRARRCLPFLTCRADWSGGPEKPIEIERRQRLALPPGRGPALTAVPRTLLSLASFELVGISLLLGRGAGEGRVDLLIGGGGSGGNSGGACAQQANDGAVLHVDPGCGRVEVRIE